MAKTKITPHVFISATSADLRSSRDIVKNTLLNNGCHPIVQEHFEPSYLTVREMLKERLKNCHAVVHLVGQHYGGEPNQDTLPEGAPRRSWTQMEYDLAKELGLKTFLFVFDDSYPFDQADAPEPADEVELQRIHRENIIKGEHLYTIVKSPDELDNRISELKLEADELRVEVSKSQKRLLTTIVAVAVMLIAIVTIVSMIKKDTSDLKGGQEKIIASVEEMRASFAGLANRGGIIEQAKSPEEHYHNARMYEIKGDLGNARKAYLEYFKFDLDFLDPHLRFQQFLKVQEGIEGARDTYQSLNQSSQSSVPQLASALLWNREQRIPKLDLFVQSNPEFAPAQYLFSQDFSLKRIGSQSLEDKRREKQLLAEFKKLDSEGKLAKWFLDKSLVSEWREDADSRLAALKTSETAMENPVATTWMAHNSGWKGTIQISELASEIFYKLPTQSDFVSTGFSSAISVTTGKPQPQPTIQLPLDAAKMDFQVQYKNLKGAMMGPFQASFDPMMESLKGTKRMIGLTRTAWVSFRDYDGKTLLYFSHLMSHRGGLREIKYGVDKDVPDTEFEFPAYNKPGFAPTTADVPTYLEISGDAQFVTVQLTYIDGETSEVVRFNRPGK